MVTCAIPLKASFRRTATVASAALATALGLALLPTASPRAENHPAASKPPASAAPATAPKAAAAAAPAPSPASPAATTPAPVKAADLHAMPDFTLPDLEGKAHASKEWQGKVVLIDFWATWCAGCRETIPALSRLQEKYGPQGLSVVGISLDKGAKSKVGKFAKKLKVNYQLLLDSEDTMSRVFGFEGLPSLYLFDREGKLIKSMVGYTAVQDKDLEALVAAQIKAK